MRSVASPVIDPDFVINDDRGRGVDASAVVRPRRVCALATRNESTAGLSPPPMLGVEAERQLGVNEIPIGSVLVPLVEDGRQANIDVPVRSDGHRIDLVVFVRAAQNLSGLRPCQEVSTLGANNNPLALIEILWRTLCPRAGHYDVLLAKRIPETVGVSVAHRVVIRPKDGLRPVKSVRGEGNRHGSLAPASKDHLVAPIRVCLVFITKHSAGVDAVRLRTHHNVVRAAPLKVDEAKIRFRPVDPVGRLRVQQPVLAVRR